MWCFSRPFEKSRKPRYLYIYKGAEVFSLSGHHAWTTGCIWTNDTILEPAWHVDGLSWSKISLPTTIEWPGTQTCPKLSRNAIISETMCQIEILRAYYALQLLILSTWAHFQRVSEHYMVTRTFLSILTLERLKSGPNSTIAEKWRAVYLLQLGARALPPPYSKCYRRKV